MPDKILIELDKSGAEWVVVAYSSGDPRMIEVVEEGKDPHLVTGSLISGLSETLVARESKAVGHTTDPPGVAKARKGIPLDHAEFLPRSMSIRQAAKKANHGLNYDEGYRTFALLNEMEERDAKIIRERYLTEAYPRIPTWHEAIRERLRVDRIVYSCQSSNPCRLKRKQRFLEAWGHELFRRAYSFIPQTTVGDVTNRAMTLFWEDPVLRHMEILAQVHDSILFQVDTSHSWRKIASWTKRIGLSHMNPVLTTPDLGDGTREFQIGTDMKIGLSWGDMREVPLGVPLGELADRLHHEWQSLQRNH